MTGFDTYTSCFLIGLLIALAGTPLIIRFAFAIGAVDKPGQRKVHGRVTPLLGGIAIFLGTWVPLGLLCFWDNTITRHLQGEFHVFVAIFLAGLAMLFVGSVDDRRGLNASRKFLVQIPVAVALVLHGIYFKHVNIPFVGMVDLGVLGPVLTVVWIVGVTNALNLIDGINGLAAGVTFFVCATNGLIAAANGNFELTLIMCSMAGASLGFLRYNFGKASIFLGDTGSLFIGVTLAATAVAANAKGTVATSMAIPILALGYPAFDTLLSMVRRKLRGRPLFSADRGHLHHKLLARGFDHRQAALVLYGICLLFCLLAIGTASGWRFLVWFGVVGLATACIVGFRFLGFHKYITPKALRIERPVFQIAYHVAQITKLKFSLATSVEEVVDLVRSACEQYSMERLEITLPQDRLGERRPIFLALGRKDRLIMRAQQPPVGASKIAQESFAFPDSSLFVKVYYCQDHLPPDLALEYRMRLGEIMEQANLCLKRLQDASEADLDAGPPLVQRAPEAASAPRES